MRTGAFGLLLLLAMASGGTAQAQTYVRTDSVAFKEVLLDRSGYGNVLKMYGVGVDEERGIAYTSTSQTQFVARIDMDTLEELPPMQAPWVSGNKIPYINPVNGFVLLVDIETEPIVAYYLDPETSRVIGSYEYQSAQVAGIAFDPERNQILLSEGTSVLIRDGEDFSAVDSFEPGFPVGGLAVASGQLYSVARSVLSGRIRARVFDLDPPYVLRQTLEIESDVPLGEMDVDVERDRLILKGVQSFREVRLSDGANVRDVTLPHSTLANGYDRDREALYFLSHEYYSADGEHGDWGKVYRYDLNTDDLDSTRFGLYPQNMAIDQTGGRLVLPNMHSGWVDIVDLANYPEKDSVDISVSVDYLALTPDRSAVYVAQRLGGNNVIRYDLESRTASTFDAGSWPAVVQVDDELGRLFVLNHYETSISVFDTDDDRLRTTIRFDGLTEGRTDAIAAMTLDPVTHRLYVSFPELERILVADGLAETAIGSFEVEGYTFNEDGDKAIGVIQAVAASSGTALAVADTRNQRLHLYDQNTFELLETHELGSIWPNRNSELKAEMLFYDDQLDAFWLGNILVPVTAPYVPRPTLPPNHRWVGYHPDGTSMYALTLSSDSLYLGTFDAATFEETDRRFLHAGITSNPNLLYSPYLHDLFAASFRFGYMLRYNLDSPSAGRPIAAADAYAVDEDAALAVAAGEGVLANDTSPDGLALSATLVTGVRHGELNLAMDGSFSYVPDGDYYGGDSFTYRAGDGAATSFEATATIDVLAVNDPPIAEDAEYAVVGDSTAIVILAASDIDSPDLDYRLEAQPAGGSASLVDSLLTYRADVGFEGRDSVSFEVLDPEGASDTGTVVFVVIRANSAPVAEADAYETDEDVALTIAADQGVLANDMDPDGETLRAELIGPGAAHGAVELAADGSFVYTPEPDFHGEDRFSYRAADGQSTSEAVDVVVGVRAVNDPPEPAPVTAPADGALIVLEGDPGSEFVIAWSAASDVDGDALTYRWHLAFSPAFADTLYLSPPTQETELRFAFGWLADRLTEAGVATGETARLAQRVVASDGTDETAGPMSGFSARRGLLTGLEGLGELPTEVVLLPNYPNPFNPTTWVRFGLPEAGEARVSVVDLLGREVLEVTTGVRAAGWHEVQLDASALGTGVYLLVLDAATHRRTHAITLLR